MEDVRMCMYMCVYVCVQEGENHTEYLSFGKKGGNEIDNAFAIVFYRGDSFPHCLMKITYIYHRVYYV